MGEPPQHFTNFPRTNRNQVGSYRHKFTLPETWKGRRTFIVFGGVDSAFYLWINGKKVGYSQDSRTPAEFDITPYLTARREPAGRRGLSVFRRFLSRGPGHVPAVRHFPRCLSVVRRRLLDLRDFQIKAGLADDYKTGTFEFSAKIVNRGATEVTAKLATSL